MIKLARYARILGIQDCAFHGVVREGEVDFGCGRVWDQFKREQFLDAVERAQEKIELYMGWPITRKAICNEQVPMTPTGIVGPTRWQRIRTIGLDTTTIIEDSAALTLGAEDTPTDPVQLQVNTSVTDPCEIKVYFEGSTQEIETLSVTIAGGVATVLIPRCHLVDPSLLQPGGGFDYYQNVNFVDAVDVKRVWVDTTTGVSLLYRPCGSCQDCSAGGPCARGTQAACGVIDDAETGFVYVRPATYANGVWTITQCLPTKRPYAVSLSYIAGYTNPGCSAACEDVPRSLEAAVFHLAHTEMPQALCDCCEIHSESWALDRVEPKTLAWDVLRNPFGTMQGQIYAYKTLELFSIAQGGVL